MDREALARMARECGFAKLGVCGVEPFADARERVASQPPLSERRQLRFDPALECPWATALLVMLWPYAPAPLPHGDEVFIDSYYAASNAAYHAAKRMEDALRGTGFRAQANVYFPAKEAAVRAGLGVIGRSSLLITPEYGTRVVIILIATDAIDAGADGSSPEGECLGCGRCAKACPTDAIDAGADGSSPEGECLGCGRCAKACPTGAIDAGADGSSPEGECLGCGRCAKACPTGAIDAGGMRHPERCLRNFMMEGVVVPEEARALMGMKLLGCDACQRACPMQTLSEAPPPVPLTLGELVAPDDAAFSAAVSRLAVQIGKNVARPQRVRAQAALLCGNRAERNALPVLHQWAQSDIPSVREHARWAIARINARAALDPDEKKR